MGSLWLLRATIVIFTELSTPSPASNSTNPSTAPILPPNVKSEPLLQKLTLKAIMYGVQYTFMIVHYERLELFPAPLSPAGPATKYQEPTSNTFGLNLAEAEAISRFWRENVACSPFRPTSLISFIRILALPFVPLKEFAEIIAMSQRPLGDRDAERVTICLSHTVGTKHRDAVLHLAATSEINFILRFVPPNQQSSTHSHQPLPSSLTSLALSSSSVRADSHSTSMEMGLRYQYSTHILRVWSGVSGGGAEEDAAHSDMLERASARARMSEPEHAVSGGMLPAVVRALLFLRNPSSVP